MKWPIRKIVFPSASEPIKYFEYAHFVVIVACTNGVVSMCRYMIVPAESAEWESVLCAVSAKTSSQDGSVMEPNNAYLV